MTQTGAWTLALDHRLQCRQFLGHYSPKCHHSPLDGEMICLSQLPPTCPAQLQEEQTCPDHPEIPAQGVGLQGGRPLRIPDPSLQRERVVLGRRKCLFPPQKARNTSPVGQAKFGSWPRDKSEYYWPTKIPSQPGGLHPAPSTGLEGGRLPSSR